MFSQKNRQRGRSPNLPEDGCSINHVCPNADASQHKIVTRLAIMLPLLTQGIEVFPSGLYQYLMAWELHMYENPEHTGASITRPPGCKRRIARMANLKLATKNPVSKAKPCGLWATFPIYTKITSKKKRNGNLQDLSDKRRKTTWLKEVVVAPTKSTVKAQTWEAPLLETPGDIGFAREKFHEAKFLQELDQKT